MRKKEHVGFPPCGMRMRLGGRRPAGDPRFHNRAYGRGGVTRHSDGKHELIVVAIDTTVSTTGKYHMVSSHDFTGNGIPEVLVSEQGGENAVRLYQNVGGKFQLVARQPYASPHLDPHRLP